MDPLLFQPDGAEPDEEPVTLIRELLAKTPEERLEELQSLHRFLDGVRAADSGWMLAES